MIIVKVGEDRPSYLSSLKKRNRIFMAHLMDIYKVTNINCSFSGQYSAFVVIAPDPYTASGIHPNGLVIDWENPNPDKDWVEKREEVRVDFIGQAKGVHETHKIVLAAFEAPLLKI